MLEETTETLRNHQAIAIGREPGVSCVDLFCGAGGLTYGLRLGGLNVTVGVDNDPACRYPYERNNPALFVERDITKVSAEDVSRWFLPETMTVLAGCAPCQPFSTYSQRYDMRRDSKWALLYEFSRIVQGVVPDVVTMENVSAIHRHQVFADFLSLLERLGYAVWSKVIECADYGVPQLRRRMVVMASRHGPLRLPDPATLPRRTVRETIGRMPRLVAGEQCYSDPMHSAAGLSRTNLKRIIAAKPGGSWRDWDPSLIAECHKADTGKSYPSVYGRMEWDKPAPTMTTQCYGFGSGRFGHPEQHRAISLREAAMLQGFPRRYHFVPPGERVYFSVIGRMIGNAVPVGIGRVIALGIREHLAGVAASMAMTAGERA
jgi:DNA (cytosine-5)-methyltransferase 1